jgi:nucleoside-triphosphate--adenylate kinase
LTDLPSLLRERFESGCHSLSFLRSHNELVTVSLVCSSFLHPISFANLQDFPQFNHLSTGDVLRENVRAGTDLGKEAKSYMDSGGLVPDSLIVSLVVAELEKRGGNLLLDGFPRTLVQAEALSNHIDLDAVMNLDVPTEIIVDRISDRWVHPASGRVYSYSYIAPKVHGKDDETGEELVQRDDDKPEAVRKRLQMYDEMTQPLVDYYSSKGVLETFAGTESDVIYVEVKNWLAAKKQ